MTRTFEEVNSARRRSWKSLRLPVAPNLLCAPKYRQKESHLHFVRETPTTTGDDRLAVAKRSFAPLPVTKRQQQG